MSKNSLANKRSSRSNPSSTAGNRSRAKNPSSSSQTGRTSQRHSNTRGQQSGPTADSKATSWQAPPVRRKTSFKSGVTPDFKRQDKSLGMRGIDQNFQKVQFFTVGEEDVGQRLDNFLMRFLRRAPKSLVYRIVRKGEVRVNKKRAKVNQRLVLGDIVRVPPVTIEENKVADASSIPQEELQKIEANILYEDKDLLVVNKPSGVAVHGGSGLLYGLIEVLRALRPLAKRLELVHRIDRDTSGCLLVAKKASVLKALHQQMRDGKFEKRYLAITNHPWPKAVAKVDLPLRKDHLPDGGWHVRVAEEGKSALSYFRVKQSLVDLSLVEVKLETGRTHQIRVHALSQGCALLGDDKYGDRDLNKAYRKKGMKRLALHAQILGFVHPVTEEAMRIEAPLWNDFTRIIGELS